MSQRDGTRARAQQVDDMELPADMDIATTDSQHSEFDDEDYKHVDICPWDTDDGF